MRVDATFDPILRRFRCAVFEMYGPDVDRVLQCGPRARGAARVDSDCDVAIFLKRMADLRVRFIIAGGPIFDAIPFRSMDCDARTPLMLEIRRDGRIL